MPTRLIRTEADKALLHRWLAAMKPPYTVDVSRGKHRTIEQNRLQRLWLNEIAEQLGDRTAEEVRGYCKLHHGVPILRAEDDGFRETYDRIIRPLDYEAKLALMMVPLDLPVSRLMSTVQKTAFLDAVHRDFSARGVVLTQPVSRAA
jgi:hypothetical protein